MPADIDTVWNIVRHCLFPELIHKSISLSYAAVLAEQSSAHSLSPPP